jgi:hypothetical protein
VKRKRERVELLAVGLDLVEVEEHEPRLLVALARGILDLGLEQARRRIRM